MDSPQPDYFKLAILIALFYGTFFATEFVQFLLVQEMATVQSISLLVVVVLGVAGFYVVGAFPCPLIVLHSLFAKLLGAVAVAGITFGLMF
ncbi:MAG: hypothetical protein AB4042_08975 [Leptolyngbyaceae cyanobacterium]